MHRYDVFDEKRGERLGAIGRRMAAMGRHDVPIGRPTGYRRKARKQ